METVQTCYGYSVREDSIMKIAGTDKNGTTLEGLMRVAKKYGLKFKACENMTIDDLKKSINSRRPCITPIQVWRSSTKGSWESDWRHGHYVVPIGYDNTNIYIH